MSSSNDAKKTNTNKKTYLQSQNKKYSKITNFQKSELLLTPPPPLLQFQRKQQKHETKRDLAEQQIENKRSLENTKGSIGKYIENTLIQYPISDIDKLIYYSRQMTQQAKEIYFDNVKLQKDYINAIQPRWVEHLKTSINNHLSFQNEMIMLYNQMYSNYLQNIYDIKTNKEEDGGSNV